MHGGVKIYRGAAGAARTYLEADRSRVDDYYLAEGTGLADRYVASPSTTIGCQPGGDRMDLEPGVRTGGVLDGDAYERWVAGRDVDTGAPKGRLRTDDKGVRFVEVVVNGPKTWSLAAALHPEVAAAYDAAQERAARQTIGWVADHATTRVGPKGRQVQVPVEQIEAAVVRHYTSRAGDPHRHLHLQVNARVWAAGRWRGIHTVGIRDSLEAINGIGHAAVASDPEFRAVLAAHGYTLDTATGEVNELSPYTGAFSARAGQIARNVDRYEAEWRGEHPDEEPGPRLRRAWDARAWADARPDKVVPTDGAQLARRWVEELHDLGYRPPNRPAALTSLPVGALDRPAAVETILVRLGARRSGWNAADIRGAAEQLIAETGIVAPDQVRVELAEDLTARALEECVPLLERDDVPEHVRSLTSPHVLAVEADLTKRLTNRLMGPPLTGSLTKRLTSSLTSHAASVTASDDRGRSLDGLDQAQRTVVDALTDRSSNLVVVEGAAGTGKTTTLAAANDLLTQRGERLLVATPTLKAADVAARQVGTHACSAARLAHQYGFRWDEDGRWWRDHANNPPAASGRLQPGDVLLVDEAGMLDQDTARALLRIADESGARVAFVGDRHQLPAVGRGGVLDLAARWAHPETCLTLDGVHRFTDPAYADLSLRMRTGEDPGETFDQLMARGEIIIHASDLEAQRALATLGTDNADTLVVADTREQVGSLNASIRDARVADGEVSDTGAIVTAAGERLGLGDRVATRRNDPDLGVANRDTWTITGTGDDGVLALTGRNGVRFLPAAYVREYVELAYATTAYGAQGVTVDEAHRLVGEQTGAAAAYVGMTRGRDHNIAHLVAESPEDARDQWIAVFSRDRADLGPGHAADQAAEDVDRYGPTTKQTRPVAMQLAALRDQPGQPRRPQPPTPPAAPAPGPAMPR
ncbi:relaxase domain-containing protein [Nocardioides panacisoli]|uniref:MobF family relaxase n=1 Tax=Nocardioides panacisoli TaxID=627624 RepID=UPI001C629805|nr:MobF family relaxase [Nocardioides panacisoli]QYJ05414.1 relaxase domain-containing protein [Nocardioides panacisoli]